LTLFHIVFTFIICCSAQIKFHQCQLSSVAFKDAAMLQSFSLCGTLIHPTVCYSHPCCQTL